MYIFLLHGVPRRGSPKEREIEYSITTDSNVLFSLLSSGIVLAFTENNQNSWMSQGSRTPRASEKKKGLQHSGKLFPGYRNKKIHVLAWP